MFVFKRLQLMIVISLAAAFFFVSTSRFNQELPKLIGEVGNYLARTSEYFPGQSGRTALLRASTSDKRPGGSMATITVSTSGQLQTALSSAHAGDTILLAAGSYGDFAVTNLSFSSQVTIESADPTHPAEFRTICISGSQGLTFENLNVHFTPNATTVAWNSAIEIQSSSSIIFSHNEIVGGPSVNGVLPTATTLDSTQDVIGLPAARAATIAHSTGVQFVDNEINTFDRGIVLQDVTGVTITGNDIHDLRRTPIDGGDVSQTVISGNYLHDLHPWNWGSGDHADFIHIWTVPTSQTGASSGLVISDNYLAQGSGTSVLGIYLDDNSNGLGFTNTQITGNVIYNGNAQGFRLENTVNSTVDGNVLLESSGELKSGPTIVVRDDATGLSITHNIISGLDRTGLTGDSRGNVLVQSVDSALANFSGILEGTPLTWLEAMQIRQHLTGLTTTFSIAPGSDSGIDLTVTTSTTDTTGTTSGTTTGGTTTGSTGGTTTSSGGDTGGTTTNSGKGSGNHGSTKGHAVQVARATDTLTSSTTKTVAAMTDKVTATSTSTSTSDLHFVEWSSHGLSQNSGLHASFEAKFGLSHVPSEAFPLASYAPTALQHAVDLTGHAWLHDLINNPHHDYLF